MYISLLIVLFIAGILEGTVTTLPLVLVCLLCLTIIKRDTTVFFAAFFVGILLDVFTLHVVGGASVFFLLFVFLILLYQRKYEIYSYPFVMVASFFGSVLFLLSFSYKDVLVQSFVSAVIGIVVFAILRILGKNAGIERL